MILEKTASLTFLKGKKKSIESNLRTQMSRNLRIAEHAMQYYTTLKGGESEEKVMNGFLQTLRITDEKTVQIERVTRG